MQPDFNVMDTESTYTVDQAMEHQRLMKAASADDIKFVQNRFPRLLPIVLPRQTEASGYKNTFNSTMTASSVGTQSLIANESIPDALPSAEVSNVDTLLDLGSITTLDAVESLGKSIGLFTSSNSKNLELSISNLVSPGLGRSGDLTSKDDLVPTPILERSVENSTASTSEIVKPLSVAVVTVSVEDDENFDGEVKSVEARTAEGIVGSGNTHSVHPQHVRLVVDKPESQCTHYTHSTAPLAEGANMLGSQVHPSTVLRQGMLSSSPAGDSQVSRKLAHFEQWPWEVALTYTICMASITIYGRTSLIQQTALEGPKTEGLTSSTSTKGELVSRNLGLLELANFESGNEDTEEKKLGKQGQIQGGERGQQ
jgi:hypothetical protein